MKIFHAGDVATSLRSFELVHDQVPIRRILVSGPYLQSRRVEAVRRQREAGVEEIMLDSGAFSAASLGIEIDLDDVYQWIAEIQPDRYVQLDVIRDPKATRANLERMRADGYSPMPVFTRGAPWSDLERLLKEGCRYIALGNMSAGRGTVHAMKPWLDGVFSLLRRWQVEHDEEHLCKTHAFGVTTSALVLTWPFFSVDSSVVVKSAGMGCVIETNFDGSTTVRTVNAKQARAWKRPELSDAAGGRRYLKRRAENVRALDRLERHATTVWKARGIEWSDA